MFKVKGQKSRSQRKVMYQQQNAVIRQSISSANWRDVVIKAKKDWRGSGGLYSTYLMSCLVVLHILSKSWKLRHLYRAT